MSLRTGVHSGLLIRDVTLTWRSLANGRCLQIRTGIGSRPVLTRIKPIVDHDAGVRGRRDGDGHCPGAHAANGGALTAGALTLPSHAPFRRVPGYVRSGGSP